MGEYPTHLAQLEVRGYHLDLYGHVDNARCPEFLEEARWQWVEEKADLGSFLAPEALSNRASQVSNLPERGIASTKSGE